MDFNLPKILRSTLRHGGELAEVYIEDTGNCSFVLENGRLERIVSGQDWGVGIRLIHNLKTAYGYTNQSSEAALVELALSVSDIPGKGSFDKGINLTLLPAHRSDPIGTLASKVPEEKIIAMLRTCDKACRSLGKDIHQVRIQLAHTLKKLRIANSEGILTYEERPYLSFIATVTAQNSTRTETGMEVAGGVIGFEIFDKNPAEAVALTAARRAISLLKAPPAPAGRMTVVLAAEAGGTMIHECVGHGLEADLAEQGLSVYQGKIGETVANPMITVRDDATISNKRGSFVFDDEGTPAENTVLIDKGVLKSYMHDRLTALRSGSRLTGNGRRMSYRFRPIVRMTTTLLSPGSDDPASILRSVDHGLMVTRMGGGQVNTVNGDFMFEVQEGFLIEKGTKGELVRGATLTGNGPEILRTIDKVGSDMGYAIGTCGKDGQGVPVADGLPTIRVPEMVVGGAVA